MFIRKDGRATVVVVRQIRLVNEGGALDVLMDGVIVQDDMPEFTGLSLGQCPILYKGRSGIDKALDQLLELHVSLLMRVENQERTKRQGMREFIARLRNCLTIGAAA